MLGMLQLWNSTSRAGQEGQGSLGSPELSSGPGTSSPCCFLAVSHLLHSEPSLAAPQCSHLSPAVSPPPPCSPSKVAPFSLRWGIYFEEQDKTSSLEVGEIRKIQIPEPHTPACPNPQPGPAVLMRGTQFPVNQGELQGRSPKVNSGGTRSIFGHSLSQQIASGELFFNVQPVSLSIKLRLHHSQGKSCSVC